MRAAAIYPRVAVRSGHKIGKSTSAALISIWYASVFAGARVILTSASARQIDTILWHEVKKIYHGARLDLHGVCHDKPSSGLRLPNGSQIFGFSTDQPERMAGLSGEHLMFVADEASGIDEAIFEAIEGNRAGGARIVLLGNPTRTSGTFYEAFTTKRDFWHIIHVSSEETPNCTGMGPSIPGLATRSWVEEKRLEWGENSPLYQVRVKGDFPSQAESSVIPLWLVDAATARYDDTPDTGPLEAGLDPARFGDDDSVLVVVRGKKMRPARAWHGLDSIQLSPLVIAEITRERRGDEKVKLRVDVIGIGAANFDQLRSISPSWLEVTPVNVAHRSSAPGYHRLRDQMWYAVKEWIVGGGAIPHDPKLEAELVAPTFTFDASGAIKVESKDQIKARIRRSPDRADALSLAVANVGINVVAAMDALAGVRQQAVAKGTARKTGDWSTW